jgi:hypothetical protein
VSNIRFSDRGFAKIRRAFREHISRMSSDAVKLYLWMHLVAFWSGKRRGTVETDYSEIAKEMRWPKIRVKRAISELCGYYVKVLKRGNQHQSTLIRILKYQKTSKCAGIPHDTSTSAGLMGETRNDTSTDTSTLRIAAKTQAIRAPKKAVEGSRSKAAAAAVWTFLDIEPCGHSNFRSLLESCWASRNGEAPSAVIGRCLDAWQSASGEGENWKRGLAPLFRALTKIRRPEKPNAEQWPKEEEIPLAMDQNAQVGDRAKLSDKGAQIYARFGGVQQ